MPKKKIQNRIDSLLADLKEAQDEVQGYSAARPETSVVQAQEQQVFRNDGITPSQERITASPLPEGKEKQPTTRQRSKKRAISTPLEDWPGTIPPVLSGVPQKRIYRSKPSGISSFATSPLTPQGSQSLRQGHPVISNSVPSGGQDASQVSSPAVLAMPFSIQNQQRALLEVLDDTPNRVWSKDELRMVEQVTDQLSLALENAFLFQETQAALSETEALYSITQAATRSLQLEEILQEMLVKILAATGLNAGAISVYDKAKEKLELTVHHNLPPIIVESLQENGLYGSLCERVFQAEITITLPNLSQPVPLDLRPALEGINFQTLLENGIHSYHGMPLISKGKVLGILNTFGFNPWEQQLAQQSLLQAAAQQIGIAIDNARLFANEQERRRIADALRELASVVGSSLELKDITERMLDQLANLIEFHLASIQLIRENHREVIARCIRGEALDGKDSSDEPTILPPVQTDPLLYEAYQTRRPVYLSDTKFDQRWRKESERKNVRSWMCAPLVAGLEVLGFLIVEHASAGTYNQETASLAIAFAAQTAVAIRNARLFEQVQSALAETDRLYQASAELNAVQSFAEILDILRQTTVLGRPEIGINTIYVFDKPWQANQPLSNLLPVAQWISPLLEPSRADLAREGLSSQVDALTIYEGMLNPEQPSYYRNIKSEDRLPTAVGEWYVKSLGMEAILLVPLNVGGQSIGFIEAVLIKDLEFTKPDLRPLSALASQAAVALQNLRLFEETRRRATQLETAAKIARDTSSTLDLDDLLIRSVNLICDRYGFYHASIFLIDDSGTLAVVRASNGSVSEEVQLLQYRLEVGSNSVVGQVTLTGQPLVVNDIQQSILHQPNPLLPETRAEMAIPLKIAERAGLTEDRIDTLTKDPTQPKGRIIGALDVQSAELNAFTPEVIAVLQVLADQLAVAVDNARAYELAQQAIVETRLRVQEFSTLYSVSEALSGTTMQSTEIAHTIVDEYVSLFNVDRASLLLHDPVEEMLHVLAVAYPVDAEERSPGSLVNKPKSGEGSIRLTYYPAVEQVMQTLQILVLQRGEALFPVFKASLDLNDPSTVIGLVQQFTETLVLVPLAVKGHTIGIIQLESWRSEPRFSLAPAQLNLVMTIANAAAVALENAQLYEEQIETAEKLRDLDKLKSQFLANMSHELRTPLNSIIGFSRVILKGIDGPVSELQQQDLSAIHIAGTHLLELINDVLDISKIEAGKMDLAFDDDVNIADLIDSAMTTAVGLIKDKPIQLERYIEANLPVVRADTTRIRQVLINFLSNAAKFTDEGTITVRAYQHMSPATQDQTPRPEIIVSITDTGPGIAKEDQSKLFRPFSQVDSSATRKVGGSGLGLSISRLLIELHNGRIGLESELGRGATFYFTLPIPYKEHEIQLDESQASLPQGSNTILVIDDDRQVIKLYERYLSEHGYRVVSLTDPTQSVETAREVRPFAITLDIMMPRKDGWQVLQELKEDQFTRDIPVVICSIIENQNKGYSLGAVDYLTKPIMEEDLVRALNRLNGDGSLQEVLVIDDDVEDLRLVEKILLQQTNYKVRVARGGTEGLVEVQTRPPHAIILDLYMPEVDGFMVLEMIRQDPVLRDIPVIIFTAGDIGEREFARLKQFSMDLIRKSSFHEDDLLKSLHKVLGRLSPSR